MPVTGYFEATKWGIHMVDMAAYNDTRSVLSLTKVVTDSLALKSLDFYNCGIYQVYVGGSMAQTPTGELAAPVVLYDDDKTYVNFLDVTALSIDAGLPTLETIDTEHIYAFANLVSQERKHSMSYGQAEKQVAKDTANLVESLDVAVSK